MAPVIEVANGDYGDFMSQLNTAANRSICYRSDKSADFGDDDADTPVIKVDSLACVDAPLIKQHNDCDLKDIDTITPPSEWSKFWTLVGRCQVCYYRDWVYYNYIILFSFNFALISHTQFFVLWFYSFWHCFSFTAAIKSPRIAAHNSPIFCCL